MKKMLIVLIAGFGITQAEGQVTWSGDVASIMYKNCTSCHNPNGVGSFSLMSYTDAFPYASSIATKVTNREMPPWFTDTTFQRYQHERILTNTERNKIIDWANMGAPEGNSSQTPPPPVYSNDGLLGTPDLKVTMPVYTSKATATSDDYICIAIPSGLTQNKKIRAVEIIPGNRNIVHHALVFIDPTATYQSDTTGGDCGGPTSGFLVTGFAPGSQPTVFPNGQGLKTGMHMQAGSNVILAMHYPHGSAGAKDSTSVNFFFYDDTVSTMRNITSNPLIQEWNFCIPPNQFKTVTKWYPPNGTFNKDYSVVSVLPHMHLLGSQIESYAVTQTNDTVPFVRIPHWDFEWQDFYFFRRFQKVPQGSRIYAKAVYDNTPGNHHNPNNPPITVCAGLNTTDEMFIVYFSYMDYLPGDENLNVDSLMRVNISDHLVAADGKKEFQVYPNPFGDMVTLGFKALNPADLNLYIYDSQGRLVRKLVERKVVNGDVKIYWDTKDDSGRSVLPGIYFYSANLNGSFYSGRLLKSSR